MKKSDQFTAEARTQFTLGNVYMEDRNYALAILAYERALKIHPESPLLIYIYALANYKEGNFEIAKSAFEKAISFDPNVSEYFYTYGQLLKDFNLTNEALIAFDNAIDLQPQNVKAIYSRALLFHELGQLDDAESDFRHILEIQPDFYAALFNLGVLLVQKQKWQNAKQIFAKILEIEPDNADAHYHFAQLLNREDNTDLAQLHFQHALDHDPDHFDARFELALIFAKCRYDHPEFSDLAIDQLRDLIDRYKTYHLDVPDRVYLILASIYDDKPETARHAIEMYATALDQSPSAQARNNLGLLFVQRRDFDLAIAEFWRAIQIEPTYENAYRNLAKIYFYEKDSAIEKDLQRISHTAPHLASQIFHRLAISLMDVARAEAYQTLYSRMHRLKNLMSLTGVQLRSLKSDFEKVGEIADRHQENYEELRSILKFIRSDPPDFSLIDVNRLLQTTLIIALLKEKNVRLIRNFCDDLPTLKADPTQLKEIFHNLIINAIEAMENGGELEISTAYLPKPQQIQIRFRDTGIGIPEDARKLIFQPGYTLKASGSGFGLEIARRIVREHGGEITVESEISKGTTFTILLPVDFETAPIQSNLQMRPIYFEARHELNFDEFV